jgi:hypothetical protein
MMAVITIPMNKEIYICTEFAVEPDYFFQTKYARLPVA